MLAVKPGFYVALESSRQPRVKKRRRGARDEVGEAIADIGRCDGEAGSEVGVVIRDDVAPVRAGEVEDCCWFSLVSLWFCRKDCVGDLVYAVEDDFDLLVTRIKVRKVREYKR
jgi:hypothetical protein